MGLRIQRNVRYLGGSIRNGVAGEACFLRFFDRTKVVFEEAGAGEKVTVGGNTLTVRGRIECFAFETVERHLEIIDVRSTGAAKEFVERSGSKPVAKMILLPPLHFFEKYVIRGGILDGKRGFIFCLLSSYGEFLRFAKAWEMFRGAGDG